MRSLCLPMVGQSRPGTTTFIMNVIITGASSGIGFELAFQFASASETSRVVAIARSADRLHLLQDRAREAGCEHRLSVMPMDVWEVGLEHICPLMDHVDVLVNNAGFLHAAPFEEFTDELFLETYRTNVLAPARLIRQLLPLMGEESPTHIVNIGSMGGVQGSVKFPGLAAYSSSKAALAGLTECLAEEFRDRNIRVNCLALGAVHTEMLMKAFPRFTAPLSAAEMASYVMQFASKAHRYYNGKVLPVSATTP